jgi:quercetin dioxygenase-like cupin family protein
MKYLSLNKKQFTELYRKHLLLLQDNLKSEKQIDMPVEHNFQPGLYIRQIFMPVGTFVIGKTHKTKHYNIVMSGRANVMVDGEIEMIQAPDMFISNAGVKKVLYILEDMVWLTTHPISDIKYTGLKFWKWGSKRNVNESDLDMIEKMVICSESEERKLLLSEVKKIS